MSEISYRVGDATLPQGDGPKVLVHVCNDAGGWGKGFVVALSRRHPEPEAAYRRWYAGRVHTGVNGAGNDFALGAVQFVAVAEGFWVANLVGQHGYGAVKGVPPVRYEAIREGLAKVATFGFERGASVHMPRIGAGLAGGDWSVIAGIIADELTGRGVDVTVYDLLTA